jgi:D-amino-acid dehydrogenase
MKVLVIGSGLIGLTTAYFLRRNGHEITVIDRADGPGRETSFAIGAMLTPSMAEPWNAPGCWRVLLGSLGRSDAALQLRLRALPGLAGWGAMFLRNSRAETFERNALNNLRLAVYSLKVMQSLREQTGIEYGRTARGSLKVFRDQATLEQASESATRLSAEGAKLRRLSPSECVELEPGLAPIADQLTGAIHYDSDETGDAYRFCVALADCARQLGVQFRFRTEVSSLEVSSGQVTAVVTGAVRIVADRYIVAAGSYSTPLLRRIGVHLPVQPAKGYSVTFDDNRERPSLGIPVIDDHWHAAVVPIDGAIRVAGTAEFTGYDLTLQPARIGNLVKLLQQVLPEAQIDPATARPWCGLRPMSADGVPIIGPTPIPNLLVNTGHGHLGWTMAAGSGQLLADLMSDNSPSIDLAPYALSRFAGGGSARCWF